MMSEYTLAAACAFGIESVVAEELRRLGYRELVVENGCVVFKGSPIDIARCNINLRCAERLFVRLSSFAAADFDELFNGVLALPWEELIPEDGVMHVFGKSVKSALHSVPACQSIVKKAVVKAMQRRYRREKFSESGVVFKIEVSILKDVATLSLDTSGDGLHKRGYRLDRGDAPLRETLAAALVIISRWNSGRVMADPMCGSGTIAIEAALYGLNIAPGLSRSFAAKNWPFIDGAVWKSAEEEARDLIVRKELSILASDNDRSVFNKAKDNASRAGVLEHIEFQRRSIEEFKSRKKYGCVIVNPPYGGRMGKDLSKLYGLMGEVFASLDSWSFFILSGYEGFEKAFGKKADKNRKLYNGNIKAYLYQYLGPLPPDHFEP